MGLDVKGIIAPVFTPIDTNGKVNISIIPQYMQHLKESGVNGILVSGTTGEGMCLSLNERKLILDAWIQEAKPLCMKVISQVGGMPLPDVISMAKHAVDVQADAIMTLPELYYKPKTPKQLVDYLEIVSKAAPSLPLIYYHYPEMSGVHVDIVDFFNMAKSRIHNFKGMKADLQVALQITEYITDQKIFIANHLLAPSLLMGFNSSIATVTNIFPSLVNDIVQSIKNRDIVNARLLQEKLNKLFDAITSKGEFVSTMKAAMEIVTGINLGQPRQPITPLDKEKRERMKENLINLGVVIKSN